jgi:hypothetical protein
MRVHLFPHPGPGRNLHATTPVSDASYCVLVPSVVTAGNTLSSSAPAGFNGATGAPYSWGAGIGFIAGVFIMMPSGYYLKTFKFDPWHALLQHLPMLLLSPFPTHPCTP